MRSLAARVAFYQTLSRVHDYRGSMEITPFFSGCSAKEFLLRYAFLENMLDEAGEGSEEYCKERFGRPAHLGCYMEPRNRAVSFSFSTYRRIPINGVRRIIEELLERGRKKSLEKLKTLPSDKHLYQEGLRSELRIRWKKQK
jgi:(2Fe-2S) ferredoxin